MHLIVIGAGPGGYETAAEAARRGLEVTLIYEGELGGTCLNAGCIPTKYLIHNCCESVAPKNFGEIVAGKEAVLSQLRGGIGTLLKKVKLVRGRASFVDSRTVQVDGTQIRGDRIIIATGSVSASLPVPGAELALDSTGMLDTDKVPSRLTVIGGGVIGLEFACIFNSLGSKVTVIEYCPGILPRFDVDMAKRLKQQLVRSGINVITGAAVTAISQDCGCYVTEYAVREDRMSVESDLVLMAVGRRPAVHGLNLEDVGIAFDGKGIKVDANMRTNVDGIYAVGDVTGGIMLAHNASAQGMRALNDISGVADSLNFDCIPAVVFTTPELAVVGKTEEDCRRDGIAFTVHRSTYRANGKAVASSLTEGCCKVLAGEDGKILGCHILGAHASDLISEAAVLMSLGATLSQARDVIHAHPTLSEVLAAAYRA